MKTAFVKTASRIFVLAIAFAASIAFLACSDSDDYLFDSRNATDISVSARMALSIDSIYSTAKSDTVSPADTVIFIADISPSKSIRLQQYYWTLDGNTFATEFSFRKDIPEPGEHTVALVIIDHFGDTLSDTLTLWVANQPILDTLLSIPDRNSEELPAEGPFSFAWHGYDPDSVYSMKYFFQILDRYGEEVSSDSTSENSYTYEDSLDPLECYQWQVTATNQLNIPAKDTLKSSFCTKGDNGESSVVGWIRTSEYGVTNRNMIDSIRVTILDDSGIVIRENYTQGQSSGLIGFRVTDIPPGNYRLTASAAGDFSDFQGDTLDISTIRNQVYQVDSLKFADKSAPRILYALDSEADTVDYADTLRFIVKDYGSSSATASLTKVHLEDKLISNRVFFGDTLCVVLPELANSWSLRFLSITAADLSGNESSSNFYIRPSVDWKTLYPETMADSSSEEETNE